jgi:hypothetical protein
MALALMLSGNAVAGSGWKAVKTADFTVFYGPGHDGDAMSALKAVGDAGIYVMPWTGSLALGVPVTVEDAGLYAQGFADPVYYRLHLFSSPPFLRDLFATEDWWELVAVHEYTHMSHMTAVRGDTAFLSAIFGRALSPNIFSPTWLTEGLATSVESTISPYQGRLNDGFFDAYLLARAKDGRLPQLEAASPGLMEFPGGMGPYLYGSGFMSWLERSRGRYEVREFVQENGGRVASFFSVIWPWIGVDMTARNVWGRGFPGLWKEWKAEVTARSASFYIDGERVTRRGWYVSDLVVDGNRLYYRRSYPVKTAAFSGFQFDEIVARDLATGREEVLRKGLPLGLSRMKLSGGKIYFATAELGRGYANTYLRSFGYETLVHEFDPASGRDRVVVRDRARSFTVLPDGRILLSRDRHGSFGSELAVFDPVTRKKEVLFSPELLVDEMVSDGTRVVASARANGENFSLFIIDLEKRALVPLVRTPFQEGTPLLQDGLVLFTANYGRTYSAYSVDPANGRLEKLAGGGFAAYPVRAGEWLYFVGLNSGGFDIYRRKYEPAAFSLPVEPAFSRAPSVFDAGSVKKGGYADNLVTMVPAMRAPFYAYEADEGGEATRYQYGLSLYGSDAIGDFPSYDLTLGYDKLEHHGLFSGNLSSQYFAPWMLSAGGGNLDGREAGFSAEYPLRVALSPGLTGVSAGASFDSFDDYTRRQVAPFESMSFTFPETRINASIVLPQERRGWGGDADGSSVYLLGRVDQYLPGSQLSVFALGFQDEGEVATELSPIRGYGDSLEAQSGAVFTADLTRPLLKIGKGIWNPTLYFEDLVAGVFADALTPGGLGALYSYGAELHLETWVSNMGLPLDWGFRVASNRDGESSLGVAVFLGYSPAAGGAWRLPSPVRGAVRAMGGLLGRSAVPRRMN